MVPWPFTFTANASPNQALKNLAAEIQSNRGLDGSEVDGSTLSFWIKRNVKILHPMQTRLRFNTFVMGKIQQSGGTTVVTGWVLPSIGGGFYSVLLLLAIGAAAGMAISDHSQLRDWRILFAIIAIPPAFIYNTHRLVTESLDSLREAMSPNSISSLPKSV